MVILPINSSKNCFFYKLFVIIKQEKRNQSGTLHCKNSNRQFRKCKRNNKKSSRKKLVRSVQQKEISSSYWWNNQIETSQEYLLEMKPKESLYKEVEQEIRKLHPYKVPEIFAEEIKEGLNEYLDWIEKETK